MRDTTTPRVRAGALAVMLACVGSLAAGCGAGARADKAGGETVTIRLTTVDDLNANGQSYGTVAFVNALGEVSDGRMKVALHESYGAGEAHAESQVVHEIADGRLDGGWPSARAFARGGISGLEALEAPMTLVNYAAVKELISGPVGAEVLSGLDGTGLVGLGLTVGSLRRPFAAREPLLGPHDWVGQAFRYLNSPTQAAAIKALGGEPVNLSYAGLYERTSDGTLRGAESDIPQALSGDNAKINNVTSNVVLWPKIYVLSVSQRFFDSLSAQQQQWVRQAAAQAVRASLDATYDESSPAAQLCDQGFRFFEASSHQLEAMHAALKPVLDDLAASESDQGLLAQIQAIAAEHPDPEPVIVPADCGVGSELGPVPDETSSLPEGTYRVEITADDVDRAGLSNDPGNSGTWTLAVSKGAFELTCRPLDIPGTDCGHEVTDDPLEVGDLFGTRDEVYFVDDPQRLSDLTGCTLPVSQSRPGACFAGEPYKMTWKLEGDRLSFSDFVSEFPDLQYLVEPWTRIS